MHIPEVYSEYLDQFVDCYGLGTDIDLPTTAAV